MEDPSSLPLGAKKESPTRTSSTLIVLISLHIQTVLVHHGRFHGRVHNLPTS